MRILSKFNDYYDSVQAFGIDKTIFYKRSTIIYDQKEKEYQEIANIPFIKNLIEDNHITPNGSPTNFREGLLLNYYSFIFFCGKIYPCFVFSKLGKETGQHFYCYTLDEITKTIVENGTTKQVKRWFVNQKDSIWHHKRNYKKIDIYKNVFNKIKSINDNQIIDLHHKLEVPILVYRVFGDYNKSFILNHKLSEYKFFKKVDTYTAYQEISMFISGVLGGQSPKMIEISDEDKKAKHGFGKMSFKKEKENKA